MPTMKRRDVLAGGGGAALAVFSAAQANSVAGATAQKPVLTVYTQDLPQARELALKDRKAASQLVPLGGDLIHAWKAQVARHGGAIEGYTSWSDYVLLRGLAEEQGLRLRAEAQLRGGAGKTVFRWIMA